MRMRLMRTRTEGRSKLRACSRSERVPYMNSWLKDDTYSLFSPEGRVQLLRKNETFLILEDTFRCPHREWRRSYTKSFEYSPVNPIAKCLDAMPRNAVKAPSAQRPFRNHAGCGYTTFSLPTNACSKDDKHRGSQTMQLPNHFLRRNLPQPTPFLNPPPAPTLPNSSKPTPPVNPASQVIQTPHCFVNLLCNRPKAPSKLLRPSLPELPSE